MHPELSGYPCSQLCGTAVAWKLCQALRLAAGETAGEEDATSTSSRWRPWPTSSPCWARTARLVRRGLEAARRSRRPGLRALIAAAGCEPSRLDEGDLAFRLGPRINAAGRLYRADAGVELLLTEDDARAEEIAAELDRVNQERRFAEREVDAAAERARGELTDELRAAPALVLAGPGWHPGVVGIVASRLAERHHRPVVLLSLDGEGGARGSGRSIPGFDLLAGLEACSAQLERFGGHRAAAGLELRAERIEEFRAAFVAHADGRRSGRRTCVRTDRIDAMVGGAGIGLELAEELGRLAPFGMGNPGVSLLVPSARVRDVRAMGEGRHSRFSLHSGAHRALGVAFGKPTLRVREEDQVDAAVRLEVNEWNGSIEPRLVLRDLYPVEPEGGAEVAATSAPATPEEWWQRLEAELAADLGAAPRATRGAAAPGARWCATPALRGGARRAGLERGRGAGAERGRGRRAALAAGAAGLARFGGGAGTVACGRCGRASAAALGEGEGLALSRLRGARDGAASGAALRPRGPRRPAAERPRRRPGAAAGRGRRLPASLLGRRRARLRAEGARGAARPARAAARALPRAARAASATAARSCGSTCAAAAATPQPGARRPLPARARRAGHLALGRAATAFASLGVVSSDGTELEGSESFRAYSARYEEGERYLERRRQP